MAGQAVEPRGLYYEERNQSGTNTIVFLHGGGSCHLEWEPVAADPILDAHHLLLVDLPRHSRSRSIAPLSLSGAASLVADVIRKHAHHGKAHVVGISLGGFVCLGLAAGHSDVLLSCFASGAMPYSGIFKWFSQRPRLIWFMEETGRRTGLSRLGERMLGITMSEKLREEIQGNSTWERTQETFDTIATQFDWDTIDKVAASGVRCCVVAGMRMDQVDGLRKMGKVIVEGGIEKHVKSIVVGVDAGHPWNLQYPDLFAQGVQAWVAGITMPSKFIHL